MAAGKFTKITGIRIEMYVIVVKRTRLTVARTVEFFLGFQQHSSVRDFRPRAHL